MADWTRRDVEVAADYLPEEMAVAVRGMLADWDRLVAMEARVRDVLEEDVFEDDYPTRLLHESSLLAALDEPKEG